MARSRSEDSVRACDGVCSLDSAWEEIMRNYKWAKMAYDAYSAASKGKSLVSGDVLPNFERLAIPIKDAWWEAANAVLIYEKYIGGSA